MAFTQEDYDRLVGRTEVASGETQAERAKQLEIERQRVDIEKQQLQLTQQKQDTQRLLVIGGLSLGGILVLVISIYLLVKAFKRKSKKSKTNIS